MDRDLDELKDLARRHGTTVERVKEIIGEIGSRSREQVEADLAKQLQPWWLPVKRVPKAG